MDEKLRTSAIRKQQILLWSLGQIEIGVGTLVKTNQQLKQAIAALVLELTPVQQEQPNVHVDETPGRSSA